MFVILLASCMLGVVFGDLVSYDTELEKLDQTFQSVTELNEETRQMLKTLSPEERANLQSESLPRPLLSKFKQPETLTFARWLFSLDENQQNTILQLTDDDFKIARELVSSLQTLAYQVNNHRNLFDTLLRPYNVQKEVDELADKLTARPTLTPHQFPRLQDLSNADNYVSKLPESDLKTLQENVGHKKFTSWQQELTNEHPLKKQPKELVRVLLHKSVDEHKSVDAALEALMDISERLFSVGSEFLTLLVENELVEIELARIRKCLNTLAPLSFFRLRFSRSADFQACKPQPSP